MGEIMKIVADCDIPYLRGALEPYAEVAYIKGKDISSADVADADGLIVRTRTRCDEQLLGGSRVGFVGTATIGYDHIDLDYCARRGIEVATAAGCNARGVLQWVAAVLAGSSRREGWSPDEKTIGVVGVGHVGSLVAAYAQMWGFRVLCCDPPRKRAAISDAVPRVPDAAYPGSEYDPLDPIGFVGFGEVIAHSDIVTFHVPLSRTGPDATFHMADEAFFRKIKPDALVLNTSRGEVVDQRALIDALRDSGPSDGYLGLRCAVDVWEDEPRIDRELLDRAAFATPHIAGYSLQGKINGTTMMVRALGAHFGLATQGWYPPDAPPPVTPRPIAWEEMRRTIRDHFDIEAESARLKADPDRFENFRDHYNYRQEYF